MRLELGDYLEALSRYGRARRGCRHPRGVGGSVRAAVDRAWALAILARGRGLLLAAHGDLEGAFASFERALAEHARDDDPFSHARTLLALGRTQRRAKQRAAARATLEDALARFETLGAPLWAEQTRAELARIGGRAPSRGELTRGRDPDRRARRRGQVEPRGRRSSLPHRALRRDRADARLPKARRPLSLRARTTPSTSRS